MDCNFLDDIKKQIKNDINNISIFSKNVIEIISFSLNDIYKLFNYWQKFNELIANLRNINWEEIDKQIAKEFIDKLSFIFDETKMSNPIFYRVFYWMQYQFWQIVVVGGMLTKMELSARLLSNSLSIFGKEPEDLIIEDKTTINTIIESEVFKNKIKDILNNFSKDGKINIENYDIEYYTVYYEDKFEKYKVYQLNDYYKGDSRDRIKKQIDNSSLWCKDKFYEYIMTRFYERINNEKTMLDRCRFAN